MKYKLNYYHFFLRLAAWLFDSLLLALVPLLFILFVVVASRESKDTWIGILWLVWIVLFFEWIVVLLYRISTYVMFKASLGKLLAGLEIEKEDRSKSTLKDALMRFPIGYTVSSLVWGLGFFWILKDPKRKGFHDHIAGTVVVQRGSSHNIFVSLAFIFTLYLFLIFTIVRLGNERGVWSGLKNDGEHLKEQLFSLFEFSSRSKTNSIDRKTREDAANKTQNRL